MKELEEERRRLRETTLRFGEALAATHDLDQLAPHDRRHRRRVDRRLGRMN